MQKDKEDTSGQNAQQALDQEPGSSFCSAKLTNISTDPFYAQLGVSVFPKTWGEANVL